MRISHLTTPVSVLLLMLLLATIRETHGASLPESDPDPEWPFATQGESSPSAKQEMMEDGASYPSIPPTIISKLRDDHRSEEAFCRNIRSVVSCGCILLTQGLMSPKRSSNIGHVTSFFLLECPDALANALVPLVSCAGFSTARVFNARGVVDVMNRYAEVCLEAVADGRRMEFEVGSLLY